MSTELPGVDETGKKAGTVGQLLRGEQVTVEDSGTYEGWLYSVDEHLQEYQLRDVESGNGNTYSSKTFNEPDIVSPDSHSFYLANLEVDRLEKSPYAVREHSPRDLSNYISKVENRGSLVAVPIVREMKEGFQIVDGHKGYFIAQEAGIETQTCIVEDFTDFEAAVYFVRDHVPPENPEEPWDDGWYDDSEVQQVIELLEQDFDDITDLERLNHHQTPETRVEDTGRDPLLELEPERFAREKTNKI